MPLSFARPKVDDKGLIGKTKNKVTRTSRTTGSSIAAKVQMISATAESKLANHKDDYILIRNKNDLEYYCRSIIANGICAIDTETTGLDPMEIDIVGVCLYTPSKKPAYIPINHKSYVTGARTDNQLTEEDFKDVFPVDTQIKYIMHNGKYDIRVLRHTVGIDISCYWDTMLAAYCIDENESHALKDLHLKYCDSKDKEALKFDSLFRGVTFDQIPINVGYLYAAGDAIKTYELYQYQKNILESRSMSGPMSVFKNIEMPVLRVVCDMEDRGVCLDAKVCKSLKEKYHKIKEEKEQIANEAISDYKDIIDSYRARHLNNKLSDPISLTSPTQLAILFYDILGLESPSKKSKRGTGEDILKDFAKGQDKKLRNLCEAILGIREVDKLLSTYIDKLPAVMKKDGRIHASFNQYGAKTGRFSSSNPNLQNIPSHNKEIRQMFKAQDGYVLIGGDYSQQEPMVTAHLSKDKKMKEAFINGKDIYATIASLAFHKPYEECKEFRDDGTVNPAGKERRTQAKSIVLGILYGRQIPSIGEQLGVSTKEAQGIYNAVLKAFPELADFIKQSQKDAKEKGYVETAWSRRRHLLDMQLEKYEFTDHNIDPLAFDSEQKEVPESVKKSYTAKLDKAYGYAQRNKLKDSLREKGIEVKDNGGFIAQAERQCVNARVQGSAADMAKLAMISINNDERMKELDFHLLICVHDEVIGECPKENAKEVKERLSYLMRMAPSHLIELPFKCDCEVSYNWYGESVEVE
jgi:DNA polymerase I-like protein with 3'-5' exonuclease and polymerase domains